MIGWPSSRRVAACALVWLSLALAAPASALPIEYHFGWWAQATKVETVVLQDAAFTLSLLGHAGDVQLSAAGFTIEGLDATLSGPLGLSSTLSNQFLGMQAPGPHQSLVLGSATSFTSLIDLGLIDSSLVPGFASYDLKSAFGLVSGANVTASFVSTPVFPGLAGSIDFGAAKDFSFEALAAAGDALLYRFGFTASGVLELTTTVQGRFELVFAGDTSDVVVDAAGNHIIEGLSGVLEGPLGIHASIADQFIGLQPPGPGQSLIVGPGATHAPSLDLAAGDPAALPEFTGYDLQHALRRLGDGELVGGFLDSLLAPRPGISIDFASAADFSFEARVGALHEPGLASIALAWVLLAGSRLRSQPIRTRRPGRSLVRAPSRCTARPATQVPR